ncbi:hypothetical protein MOUN0_F00584 [Monosporozyma unispora]|nr:hypothetical protein C6P44_004622 [Kazachstania unispora]
MESPLAILKKETITEKSGSLILQDVQRFKLFASQLLFYSRFYKNKEDWESDLQLIYDYDWVAYLDHSISTDITLIKDVLYDKLMQLCQLCEFIDRFVNAPVHNSALGGQGLFYNYSQFCESISKDKIGPFFDHER